jgi:hypothetical protein
MQRNGNGNGNGPSVGWTIASIPFHTAPGIGWRLHIKKIAAEIGTVVASSRTTKNRQPIDYLINELVWTRRMRRNAREHEIKIVQAAV